jgi:hypothetical protein
MLNIGLSRNGTMRRILLTVSLLTYASTAGIAQAPFAAEQIDVFGRISCDDLGGRSQNFANQILAEPNSKALVVVHPEKGRVTIVKGQFRQILKHFAYYMAEDRLEFLISDDQNEPRWEFWKIPAGATEPNHKGEKWTLPPANLTKAFIYDYEDENGICSTFVIRKYAELLIKNPGSRAHIVVKKSTIYPYSVKGFADQWIKELSTTYSIPKKRIRVFYVRGDNPLTYAEFWFVPRKKR